jgi:hypothetical protein
VTPSPAVVAALRALSEGFERLIAALESEKPLAEMIAQDASPLGRRRHCAAVKRRIASGAPGAALVGRRHLLNADALEEELTRVSGQRRPPAAASPAPEDVRDELARAIRALKGG